MISILMMDEEPKPEMQFLLNLRKLPVLASSLEEGRSQAFFELLSALQEQILSLPLHLSTFKIEVYYSFGLLFISYLNKKNIRGAVEERVDLSRLYSIELSGSDKEILDYFNELARAIFDANDHVLQEGSNLIIEKVNRYIRKHLMNELSLTIIGQAVGYNPSYLSRVYKHSSGIGIAEYILVERTLLAQSLLKESGRRINEIAAKSGFISEAHFFRIFKKRTGLTPSEYRNLYSADSIQS